MAIDPLIYSYVLDEEIYPDKAMILEEGSKRDWIYVVLEGRVQIRKMSPKGLVTLATLKEGDIFGEMIFLEKGKESRSESAIATDGTVRLGILDSQRFLEEYQAVSSQLKDLIRALIIRLKNTNEKVSSLIAESR